MSIASELNNYRNGLGDAWDAAADMGATIPTDRNMANLDQAIRTIPQSQGATYTAGNGINIDANNEISVDTSVVATQTDLAGKQDTLTAGSNMDITNNVISAKVDSALSASSTNPVQNSVVKAALDGFISEDDLYSEVCGSGTTITFQDAPDNAPLSDFKLKGETSQNGTPTPDAPVPVQTVTGENVVKINGKNLFDVSAIPYVAKRAYDADGTELVWNNYSGIDGYQQVAPNTTYTITKDASGSVSYLCEYDKNKAFIQEKLDQRTFTTTANTHYLRWSVYSQGNVAPTQTQLELGSSASSFEPYQGQSYEVNLGNIELCKIGDYQDYIYKSGSKWYVRKEIGKIPSYAGEAISTDYASTTGSLTTGATIYYVLAAPTDTEITNEALVAQLEAILSQGHTYAGTNNITTVIAAGNAQGELEICYTKTLLPIATETNLGLVQIGSGLSITPNGVLSATGGGAAQNEPIVVWLDWDSVGTDLEILGTATGQFMDNYTSSATAVGSSFFAGAVSDNKQVIIRTGGGLPAPGTDWATETVRPVQVKYDGMGSATMYFWHETMFVRAQCPDSGTTWTFTKLSV